jgi:uncharacterized protein
MADQVAPDEHIDDSTFPDHARDEKRHKDRIRDKLRKGISDILKRRDIITGPTDRRVLIPIRSDEDPIIHVVPKDPQESEPQDGIGQGPSKPGDVVGWAPNRGAGAGPGEAGNEGHDPDYIVEMSVDDLAEWVFAELRLPLITPRRTPKNPEETVRLNARNKRGEFSRLDKKDSLMRHLRRQVATGDDTWYDDDLRFRQFRVEERPGLDAVVFFVRDASGSMGEEETQAVYLAAWWTVLWLRRNYPRVTTRFILHGTEAQEVTEGEFFSLANMGGTMVSSGLKLAKELMERDHPEANTYVLFYSDGENWTADNTAVTKIARVLADRVELVGYGEISFTDRQVPLYTSLLKTFTEDQKTHGAMATFRSSKLNPTRIRGYLWAMFGPTGEPQDEAQEKAADSHWNLAFPGGLK